MAAIAVGLFLVGYYWGNQYQRNDSPPLEITGVLIRPPHPLPDFRLRDPAGRPFTPEQLAGRWTLLAFGRPSQSPGRTAMERMIRVRNHLAGDPRLQERLQLLLVARHQDPALETGPWSRVLKPLSGADQTIRTLRAALGLPEQETDPTTAQGNPCYLIGPAGRFFALFPDVRTPASIASDLTTIAARNDAPETTHD